MIPWLDSDSAFPPLELALSQPNGLLAAGGDLSPSRLLDAYRHGIFPWYSEGQPILWWSPDPRLVLFPGELKVSRSLARRLKKEDYQVRFDSSFRDVMLACATAQRPDQDGTWIMPAIVEGYTALNELGYAHSAETWINGELAGGLYGVAIGGVFYGESMFHRTTDASKIAFAYLVRRLQQQGFGLIDCQMHTPHLQRFGAREIPRSEFAARLAELVNLPCPVGKWCFDDAAQ
jgi:leucyl/phenylalanyl-tRNA--protein transferase